MITGLLVSERELKLSPVKLKIDAESHKSDASAGFVETIYRSCLAGESYCSNQVGRRIAGSST